MMLRNSAAILVILAATGMWGQSTPARVAPRRQPVVASSNAEGVAAANRAKATANQSLQDMGATLTKMQELLKQMRAHMTSAKDPVAKANLDMWTLMVDQLDKQYEQMRLAARQREEMEARRAALYKQADERAAEAAKKAQEAQKAAAANPNNNQTPAAPGAAQTTTTAPSSTSPN
jgi:DNA-binding transcriptional MerR regulator